MQNVTSLLSNASLYANGFTNKSTYRMDTTKSQKLSRPEKASLIKIVSESLVDEMRSICPITGLTTVVDFPALPGFYMEAYHPLVHNVRNIIKNPDYCKLLTVEQKAGLILGSLSFYKLLSTTTPALILNLAIVSNIPTALLDSIITFISESAAVTNKAYPILVMDAAINAAKLQEWMNACYDVEHFDYNPVTLESLPAHEQSLFKVPKLISTDKQIKMYDKECQALWEELLEVDVFPKDFITKAKPFISTLVSNLSSSIISKLLVACENKLEAFMEIEGTSEEGMKVESLVEEFVEVVTARRASAERLGLYANLDLDSTPAIAASEQYSNRTGHLGDSTVNQNSSINQPTGSLNKDVVEGSMETIEQKVMAHLLAGGNTEPAAAPVSIREALESKESVVELSPFQKRIAALKAKGVI